jgi:flavin-dependent dehydrogenase
MEVGVQMVDYIPAKMSLHDTYDVAIIGGGLAGLASAIALRHNGHSVVLFEKETYPFHKVCGEYVSFESKPFLQSLGFPFDELQLPVINSLLLTAPNGRALKIGLDQGAFGISRFQFDHTLAKIAKQLGVMVLEQTKVTNVRFTEEFSVSFSSQVHTSGSVQAKVCLAAFGKRSNLDIKMERSFVSEERHAKNYMGVKYHVKAHWPENLIGLHGFEKGYCGISRIEEDKYCLCYLADAAVLKKGNNSIQQLEERVLSANPHIKKILEESEKVQNFPVTISKISFRKKLPVEDHLLMLGDAAGMITPLCGNGMSIALHTGKIAAMLVQEFLNERISRTQMEQQYTKEWNQHFNQRFVAGRTLQSVFGNRQLSNAAVFLFQKSPRLAHAVIRQTHGKPF